MVGLTVDTGSSVAEGSQCAPFSDSRWRAESTVGSYGLSLELRQPGGHILSFRYLCGDGRVRYLRVDAQQVDLVGGNAEGRGKDIFKALRSDQIIKFSVFANPI